MFQACVRMIIIIMGSAFLSACAGKYFDVPSYVRWPLLVLVITCAYLLLFERWGSDAQDVHLHGLQIRG